MLPLRIIASDDRNSKRNNAIRVGEVFDPRRPDTLPVYLVPKRASQCGGEGLE